MKAALVIFESGPIMSGPSDGRGPMYHVCTSKVQGECELRGTYVGSPTCLACCLHLIRRLQKIKTF